MFLQVSRGGIRGCGRGAWLQGACVVAGGMRGCRGHAWLWVGGGHAWLWGVCLAVGGVHGCVGDMHGCGGVVCGIQQDKVNERTVRILLECILVLHCRLNTIRISINFKNTFKSLWFSCFLNNKDTCKWLENINKLRTQTINSIYTYF